MNGFGALVAFAVGWLVSQITKIFTEWVRLGKISRGEVFALLVKSRSGGMPSGHTASMVGLTTYIGFFAGWDSAVFALAVGVVAIVVYDAMNVRRSVGDIGAVLKKEKKIHRVVDGHTLAEVIAGAVVGILVGWSVFLLVG